MKEKTVLIQQLEVGDFVRTPDGVGAVTKVIENIRGGHYLNYDILVQHKRGNSNNSSNDPKEMEGMYAHLITYNEYVSEMY